jgi:NAD(P)H-hydrate repair Nnr-like enzyme with NAD(P)H-hydrate epimerase domain
MIHAANASQIEILAIDIPSGVNADTAYVEGEAINAQTTVCFIGYK